MADPEKQALVRQMLEASDREKAAAAAEAAAERAEWDRHANDDRQWWSELVRAAMPTLDALVIAYTSGDLRVEARVAEPVEPTHFPWIGVAANCRGSLYRLEVTFASNGLDSAPPVHARRRGPVKAADGAIPTAYLRTRQSGPGRVIPQSDATPARLAEIVEEWIVDIVRDRVSQ